MTMLPLLHPKTYATLLGTLLGATLLGEWSYTLSFEHAHDPQFWLSVVGRTAS